MEAAGTAVVVVVDPATAAVEAVPATVVLDMAAVAAADKVRSVRV